MKPDKAQAKLLKMQPGQLVHIVWLDSGATTHDRRDPLSARDAYGRIGGFYASEHYPGTCDVLLEQDVCRDDPHAVANHYGRFWVPSVIAVYRLKA